MFIEVETNSFITHNGKRSLVNGLAFNFKASGAGDKKFVALTRVGEQPIPLLEYRKSSQEEEEMAKCFASAIYETLATEFDFSVKEFHAVVFDRFQKIFTGGK